MESGKGARMGAIKYGLLFPAWVLAWVPLSLCGLLGINTHSPLAALLYPVMGFLYFLIPDEWFQNSRYPTFHYAVLPFLVFWSVFFIAVVFAFVIRSAASSRIKRA
jgi:hypothetical protein